MPRFGTPARFDDLSAFFVQLDQPFPRYQRFDNIDSKTQLQQSLDFISNRRQATSLNFDQPITANDINSIAAEFDFQFGVRIAEFVFELFMKGRFQSSFSFSELQITGI